MIIRDLEEKIATAKREGGHPFLVAATAGTTVLGSFDPFDQIADVCEANSLWFHFDVRAPPELLCTENIFHVRRFIHGMLCVKRKLGAKIRRSKKIILT